MRGDDPKQYRVLNLIRKVNLDTASPKKRAVIALLKFQPTAILIRFEGRCPGCRRDALMSYVLPRFQMSRRVGKEDCGYFCPHCDFGNAGSRPKRPEKHERTRKSG